ncbi:MAG: NADH:flavin oxidoreductase [Opitutales bacterium]|nr:NADH:flavin oxidoreductase [Opitutales bacterium]
MKSASFLQPLVFTRTGVTAPNRVALAAMTNQQSLPDGTVGDDEYRWLTRRAEGGFGIVTTCAAHVHPRGRGWLGALGIDNDSLLPRLRCLSAGIRVHGARALVQIFHGGARAPTDLTGMPPLSASTGNLPGESSGPPAVEATEEEIAAVIAAFAAAARRAEAAGWDGVELHGAHGYLLAQFLSPLSNRRRDRWGGALDNRMRLLRETLAAVKSAVSPRFLVGVRLSPRAFPGQDTDTTREAFAVARTLIRDGVDFLHFSLWDFRTTLTESESRIDASGSSPRLLDLAVESVAGACPLFVAGKIHTPADAAEAMAVGADVAALGRVAIPYPDWPRRAAGGAFEPALPPYRTSDLASSAVGPPFLDYLRRWPGFVEG